MINRQKLVLVILLSNLFTPVFAGNQQSSIDQEKPTALIVSYLLASRSLWMKSEDWKEKIQKPGAHEAVDFENHSWWRFLGYRPISFNMKHDLKTGLITISSRLENKTVEEAKNELEKAAFKTLAEQPGGPSKQESDQYTKCIPQIFRNYNHKSGQLVTIVKRDCESNLPLEKLLSYMVEDYKNKQEKVNQKQTTPK